MSAADGRPLKRSSFNSGAEGDAAFAAYKVQRRQQQKAKQERSRAPRDRTGRAFPAEEKERDLLREAMVAAESRWLELGVPEDEFARRQRADLGFLQAEHARLRRNIGNPHDASALAALDVREAERDVARARFKAMQIEYAERKQPPAPAASEPAQATPSTADDSCTTNEGAVIHVDVANVHVIEWSDEEHNEY